MKQKGFTLVEMLIAIGIIGILSIVLLMVVNPLEQFQKANDSRRKSDLAQIQRALEQYYQDHGQYPRYSTASPLYEIVDFNNINANPRPGIAWGNPWQPYMNFLPKDPDSGRTYIYVTDSSYQTYWLYASLERGTIDSQSCNNGSVCGNVPANVTCGGSNVCNYGVSSTNTSP
ncbi:MAG TPA: prepilin-type N-terminal cleavage/methylation domain-containing protein [Patescibacteria group bacterium]|nr:prepilin-type N-terminal cleavage/methylation domain-containing protein [Patescibacteria group bacterium]